MNIVFMGTPEFSVPTLQRILDAGHNVQAVVTKEDKPKGRGQKVEFTPVKQVAIERDLNILQPSKLKDLQFVNTMKILKPDVIVVIAYGKILPKEILSIPTYGCINVHASLLPKYRGAAPIHWAIINGEKYTGVTTMFMDQGMDTGDILLTEKVEILDKDTTGNLHDKLAIAGSELLVQTLKAVAENKIERIKQNNEEATYTKMIDKSMGLINWQKKSHEVINLIRGLSPWPSAYTFYQGKMMKIWEAEKLNDVYDKSNCGEIVQVADKGITVKTGDGSILITKIQMQNSKIMYVKDYINGNKLEVGEVLDIE